MRSSSIGIAMAGALLLAPRPAPACGPPFDPTSNDPPCELVKLWTPAPTFPRQLERALRIGTFDQSGGGIGSQPTFDPNVQIFVHRALPGGGYEAVAFQLVPQAGLVPNALHLQLADPSPGQYIVSSPQMTCTADASPTGTGLLLGTFEIGPEVALPTTLGDLTWLGQQLKADTYKSGPDAMCQIKDVAIDVSHSTLSLRLPDDALPWAAALESAIYVDGSLYQGYSPLFSQNGTATVELTRVCSSSDPSLFQPEDGVGDGAHRVKLVGQIEGLAMIESNETTFTLDCDDSDSGWLGGGCAAGDDSSSWSCSLLVLGVVIVVRRSRRRVCRA